MVHPLPQVWMSFTNFLPEVCLSNLFARTDIRTVEMGKDKICLRRR